MKRQISILACLVLVVAMVVAMASCNLFEQNDGEHTHSYVDGKCECGAVDPDAAPEHTHNYVDGKCECGESDPDYTPECEHAYSYEVTTEATCTEGGVKTYTCTVCGDSYTQETSPNGHKEETVAGKAPTCTEPGLSSGKKCTVCGETTKAQVEIGANGHSFADGFCSACGEADPNYNGPKTYVLDVQTLSTFAAGSKTDGQTEVVGDFFTIYYSAKTKIDTTKDKTWSDGYSFAEGLRLNWGGTTSVGETTKNAIEIVVDGTATVKVWWICGGDGREIGIFDANGDLVVASATKDSFTEGTEGEGAGKNGVYLSELALDAAGTYYIGTDNTNAIKNGGNIICKVEVTVTPAEEVKVQGNGTQDSPFVLPSTGDYTCAYPGGNDLVYYAYTVSANSYVTVSSSWTGSTWLKIGTDIYNLSTTNDGNGQPVKVLALAGSTVYFGVADWEEQAAEISFTVSTEEVTFGTWDHLVGSWKGNIASFWTTVGYTVTINADGTGNINENGGYYNVNYPISSVIVIGNTVIFNAADEYGNAPVCNTFTYDAESNTLVADSGTLYVDDGSGTPVNPDVSYDTVIVAGSNTLYFSEAEIAADAAERKLTITVAGNYKFAAGNLFVSGIIDANGNAIAKNEDYTYTLAEGEYTVCFSMLSMFGVIADNGCELNVTVPEVVDPGTGDDDDDEYPEFQFDALKDAILGWYDFDGYSVMIFEKYEIGTYLANVFGDGYDLYFTFDVTVNADGSSTLTLYHYYVDYETNPDMIETVLGYNIVIGGSSDEEPVDATDITTLPGTGISADPFVITESDNYFLTNVNSYPGYLVSFGGSGDITVTIKADVAELYSKSWATKYAEEGVEYTFTVKAGETLTMWVVMETGTADKVIINVTIDGEGAGAPDVDDAQAAANATLNGTYAYQPEEGLAFIVNFNNGLITVLRDDLGLGLPESFAYNYTPMMGSISTEYGYFYVDVTTGDLYYGRGWLLAPYVEGEDPVVPSTPALQLGDNTVTVTDTWNGTTVILSAENAITYVIAPGANTVVVYDYSNYFNGDKLEIALAAGESVELIVLTEDWSTGDVVVNVSEKAEVPGGDIPEGVVSTDLTFTAPKAWAKTEEQIFIAGVAGDYIITATGYDAIVKTYLQYYDAAADSWTRIDTELPYTITLSAGQELKFRLYGWDNSDEGKEIVVHIYTEAASEPACEHNNVSNTIVGTTCTTDGSYTTTCDDCGEVLYTEITPATGHDYDNIVTDPTCVEAGYTEHICAICDYSYTDSEVPATGEHSWKAPTCTADGYCTVCEAEGEFATGHADNNADYKCDACSTKMLPADGEALTIAQALAIAKLYSHNTYTTQKYYITGIISNVYNTQYGNMYIKDDAGNELCIYGLYSYDGEIRYDAMEYKPLAGDEITVYTVLGAYNDTLQGKNAWLDEVVHEHKYSEATCAAPATCVCGLTQGEALAHDFVEGSCTKCGSVDPDYSGEVKAPTYVKVTSADQLTTGTYVMVVNGLVATKYDSSSWVLTQAFTGTGDTIVSDSIATWTLTVSGSSVTIKDANGTFIKPKSGNNNGIQTGSYNWAWTISNGNVNFKGTGSDTTILALNKQEGKIRAYKTSTVSGNASGYPSNFTLYKLVTD